ncbi:MAG: hypothetical protein J5659_07085 [Clostridia bacterium]|nr:hypothetical protein [Clostridia bacterium]
MTVSELSAKCGFETVCVPDNKRQVSGAYIGDLLSWVMGRASADNAWITIMSNINVIAVAALTDVACVILAEDVCLDDEIVNTAKSKGVNVLKSSLSAYETAILLTDKI